MPASFALLTRNPTFRGTPELVRARRVVRTLPPVMTTIDAVLRAGIARGGMVIGKERTATVRLRVADLRWTTTRPRVAATTTRTVVDPGTTLRRIPT
jgi:hypothetical protein